MKEMAKSLAAALGLLTSVCAAPLQSLPYAAVETANPLKGFMPYSGNHTFPHSMEFFYLPLKDLMDGPASFTWQALDSRLDAIAARGHQSVLRVYLDYPTHQPGTPDFLRHGPDGISGTADDLEMRTYQDHNNNGISLSPDYTNPHLRAALQSFIAALGARYDGDPRIGFIQIGLLGFWGEWHTYPYNGNGNPDWMPPLAVQEEILTVYNQAFNTTPLLVREPKNASFQNYAIGYHDDSFAYSTLAPPNWHFSGRLAAYGESERWKTQPIGGEIRPELQPGMWEDPSIVPSGQDYALCLAAIHPSWMLAYGAFSGNLSPAARTLAEQQSRALGYEFHVPSFIHNATTISSPVHLAITLRNTGIAPFYHQWPLELAVLNDAGAILQSVQPAGNLTGLLPTDPDRVISHVLPADMLPAGNFKLLLRVVNPLPSGMPLRFANTTQDADLAGWLTLGTFTLSPAPPAYQLNDSTPTGSFNDESNPTDPNKIRSENGQITYIQNNTWAAFRNFDFASGATYFEIEGASPNAGGTIELRTGSENGPLITTVVITDTGGWSTYQKFGIFLTTPLTGIQDLYLRFTGGGGYLFNTRDMRFLPVGPGLKQPGSDYPSGAFEATNQTGPPVIAAGAAATAIQGGSWVVYHAFDFGAESNRFTIEAATPGKGGTIELRTGAPDGRLIGSLMIPHTGSLTHFRPFTTVLERSTSGIHDLYFRFIDTHQTGGTLFHTRQFKIEREVPPLALPLIDNSDGDAAPNLIEFATGMHPASRDCLPLDMAVPKSAAPGFHHDIQVRLRADDSLASKLLVSHDLTDWDEVTVFHQNGAWHTDNADVTIDEAIPQGGDLYLLRLSDRRTQSRLFTRLAVGTREGGLHVYPPVPALAPSPYYTFSVQKITALNAPEKENATNWEHPFAWFTRCVDHTADLTGNTAYYSAANGKLRIPSFLKTTKATTSPVTLSSMATSTTSTMGSPAPISASSGMARFRARKFPTSGTLPPVNSLQANTKNSACYISLGRAVAPMKESPSPIPPNTASTSKAPPEATDRIASNG